MKKIIFLLVIFSSISLFGQQSYGKMILRSSAFYNDSAIPKLFTCEGENISPPLSWEKEPEGTVSFVIICEDPDAPMGTWIHWVYYNIPRSVHGLHRNVPPEYLLSTGGRQGITSFNTYGYGGPCPPEGTHRYYFKLYALDILLTVDKNAGKSEVEKAMKGHILAESQLMGTFTRNNK